MPPKAKPLSARRHNREGEQSQGRILNQLRADQNVARAATAVESNRAKGMSPRSINLKCPERDNRGEAQKHHQHQ